MSNKKKLESFILIVATIGSLVLLNILASNHFFRFHKYPLGQATIDALAQLKDPVTIRAYFTKELPPQLAAVSDQVRDVLDDYYANSKGKFRYEFIDPTSEETEEDKQKKKDLKQDIFGRVMREKTSVEQELEMLGILPFGIRVNSGDKIEEQQVYMGLSIHHGDKKEVIPAIQRTHNLEYELTSLIRKVSREQAPKIAMLTGHENPDIQKDMKGVNSVLQKNYEVSTIDLTKEEKIADDVDAILIVGPKIPFAEKEIKAIDDFIMSGRSAAFLLGPVAPEMQTLQPNPTDHGLTDLLKTYGAEIQPSLVLDVECAPISVARQQGPFQINQRVQYPFIPLPKSLDPEHPLTRGLARVAFPFTGPVEIQKQSGGDVEAEILVETSQQSWTVNSPFNLDPTHQWTRDEVGELSPKPLVATLSGAIPSYFSGGSGDDKQKKKAENARLLVVNGHAFVLDQFMSPTNQAFVLNLLDWMVMDDAMLAIRSRGLEAAPLDELSDASRKAVKYANIVGLPLAFIAFGIIRWRLREARRRRIRL
jgi:gliding-associated putative ABC transporter substrate-binding component GldG